ncbi:colicin E3/pyocin S6 family cytotoxin [Kitasatospora sp. MMS16-BH015]|uniref:colicin E3/pyocin S6 family cytotoxin n=1 Tax=Kitasatospora sp. MMS16-BH015 TaxID=2018025 RepID=UPI000CF2DEF0|nr:colicin E3/pyocin S6 family cytotoxin [Kitasatospora sp. MMS16-BH015]
MAAAAVLVTLVQPPPESFAAGKALPGFKLPAVQKTASVAGTAVPAHGAGSSQTDSRHWAPAPKTAWPAPATAEIDLSAAARPDGPGKPAAPVKAPNLPVAVAPATASDPKAAPAKVAVQVADHDAATRLGLDGVVLGVNRTDGISTPGKATVQVDYSGFKNAHGADWASRLTLVQLPACALTEPQKAECRTVTELKAVNDPKAGTVSAEVTTAPATQTAPAAAASRSLAVAAPAAAGTTVLAATAAPSGGSGDYSATPLAPSGSWSAGGSSGAFTWSYPMDVPSVPGGQHPNLGLSYSSAAIDGRTASTNNQSSWVGDGWTMELGAVERRYTSCKEDTGNGSNSPAKTGDLCWKSDNATVTLNGKSTELVKDDATGTWKLGDDDGSRVEHLNGSASDTANGDGDNEYWKITTTDGTQYFFGKNRLPGWSSGKPETNSAFTVPVFGNNPGEPGNSAAFKDSAAVQAWRWNLDYVVDPHNNAMALYYARETGAYAKNAAGATSTPKADAAYTRAGYLDHIEYGHRAGQVYAANPAAKVNFSVSDRCLATDCSFTKANAANWPDVPVDQSCDLGADCLVAGPTFWSKKRLTGITTQVQSGGSYKDVDAWALTQQYPGVGDAGGPALWLDSITRTGKSGATPVTLPKVDFGGTLMPNRVDTNEGRPPLNKYRITRISSESGSDTLVDYSPTECTAGAAPKPDANTGRCFPTWWTPVGSPDPVLDWFHKYVITKVTKNDTVAGSTGKVTEYEYLGGAAWRRDDSEFTLDKYRTWNVYRGYGTVRTRTGTTNKTLDETVYFRGMDGDKLADGTTRSVSVQGVTDEDALAGTVRESATYDGDGGKKVSSTTAGSWVKTTASRAISGLPAQTATYVRPATETAKTLQDDGSWRTTTSTTGYDPVYGLPVTHNQDGDTAVTGDEMCVRTTYVAPDTANWLIAYPSSVRTASAVCSTEANAANTTSEDRTYYDQQGLGIAPKAGQAFTTKSEDLDRFDGTTPVYVTDATATYDAYGRTLTSTDVNNRSTTTEYTPAAGTVATTVKETDPKGFVTTTTIDPLRGQPLSIVDENNRTTFTDYDALGRLTSVWTPGRAKTASANTTYSYDISRTKPPTVTTKTLLENGKYRTSTAISDGLLRSRQTQSDAADGSGRLVADTFYDSHGYTVKSNAAYWNDQPVSTALLAVADNQIPSQQVTEYDGQGRPTAQIVNSLNIEKWRTTTAYGGDWTSVTPPTGGTATLKRTDAWGRTTELRQYKNGSPLPGAGADTYESVTYAYNPTGRLAKVTDQAGNTWTYGYDLSGNQTTTSDPDKGTASATYNTDGTVATTTDSRGRTLASTYDELGRRTSLRDGSTTGTKLAEWTYDTVAGGKNMPASMTRWDNGNAYTTAVTGYDGAGRTTGTTVTVPAAEGALAGTYAFKQAYSANTGRTNSTSYPAGGGLPAETVYQGYTETGLETSVDNGNTVYSLGTSYSPYGETLQTVLGDIGKRTVQTFTYENATGRLATVTNDREAAGPQTLDAKTYTYDPAGNITRIHDDRDDKKTTDTQCFSYDFARRVTEAWTAGDECAQQPGPGTKPRLGGPAPYWESYSYDAVGNRTGQVKHDPSLAPAKDVTRTSAYPAPKSPHPHAVTGITTTGPGARSDSFEYDSDGNTTRRVTAAGDQALEWDAEGHLAKSTTAGRVSTYLYDADGERLIVRDSDAVTLYLDGQELKLTKATGKVTGTRYIPAGDATVVKSSDGTTSYLLADHQGTDQTSVNATTLAYTRRDTSPFGEQRGTAPTAWPGTRGFVGGTNDTTSLTHLGAREYDPANGRFISADPVMDLTDPQQINGYAYANNSPVTASDPDGLWPKWLTSAAKAVVNKGAAVKNAVVNTGKAVAHTVVQVVTHPVQTAKKIIKATPLAPVAKAVSHLYHSPTVRKAVAKAVHTVAKAVSSYVAVQAKQVRVAKAAAVAIVRHAPEIAVHTATMAVGALGIVAGAVGDAGGVVMSATGVGAGVGVPAVAVSTGAVVAGGAAAWKGAEGLGHDLGKVFSEAKESYSIGTRVMPPNGNRGDLPGFPDAKPSKAVTGVQGGGGRRPRWIDKDGKILEWDYQHGKVEKYSKNGKEHLGEFDPFTGKQTKPGMGRDRSVNK